jgi:hypothetical protein
VVVKTVVMWKITLRGLGDTCRIFYEKRSRSRTPNVPAHKVCISAGLLVCCYDSHCHFVFAYSHTRPWFIAPAHSVTKFCTDIFFFVKNTKFGYCLRTEYIPYNRPIKGYFCVIFFKKWNGSVLWHHFACIL